MCCRRVDTTLTCFNPGVSVSVPVLSVFPEAFAEESGLPMGWEVVDAVCSQLHDVACRHGDDGLNQYRGKSTLRLEEGKIKKVW
jgi:hypothetical protein